MKKTFIALFAIAMIGGTVASCKKDKKTDCTSIQNKIVDAAKAWSATGGQTSANCNTYKAALQDYFNSDCVAGATADQKALYQEILNGLNCDAR